MQASHERLSHHSNSKNQLIGATVARAPTSEASRLADSLRQIDIPPERHPTAAACAALTKQLGFTDQDHIQDWERFFCDPNRIDEFLDLYQTGALDDDEKFLLMDLILASFADADIEVSSSPEWARCLHLLRTDRMLHAWTIWFWASIDEETGIPDNDFTISPLLQDLLLDLHQAGT